MKRLCLILFILLGVVAKADKLPIWNLSRGLVKAAAPALVGEGQAIELRDFSFTTQGALSPRWGYSYLWNSLDSFGGIPYVNNDIWALFPYNIRGHKRLLALRENARPAGTGMSRPTQKVTVIGSGVSDTVKSRYFYNSHRFKGLPISPGYSSHYLDNLLIGSANSELKIYDGTKVFDARPRGPGQLHAMPIDSGGNVTGTFIYKYAYYDKLTSKKSNLSLPSFPISVIDGKVILRGFAAPLPGTDTIDHIYIYKDNVNDTNSWDFFTTILYDDTICIDNYAYNAPSSNPFDYPWGPWSTCYSKLANCAQNPGSTFAAPYLWPPGAPRCSILAHTNFGVADLDTTQIKCQSLEYSIVFIDSCRRHSYPSPTFCQRIPPQSPAGELDSLKAKLTEIAVPEDPHIITKKLLLRRTGDNYLGIDSFPAVPEDYDGFYVIDTLSFDCTIYIDTNRIDSVVANKPMFCRGGGSSRAQSWWGMCSSGGYTPELYDCKDDSVISFRPTDLILHDRRMFAIGNPDDLNRLYYSKFGYPTNWPSNHSIGMPSAQGDWFVRLYELGENLVLFRQNSIVLLSGLTFYQFRTIDVKSKVGATAPQSVAGDESHVYFLHVCGIYEMVIGQVPTKISRPIQSYFDSLNLDQMRGCVGAMVDGEYWLSHPNPEPGTPEYNNSRTLVYKPASRNWRIYTFGFQAMVNTNLDPDDQDFNPSTYVFARNDSLFYLSDTLIEDVDVVVPATYQTKVLFAEPGRVKVNYIDFDGIGQMDSLLVFTYENSLNALRRGGWANPIDTLKITSPDWVAAGSEQQTRVRIDRIAKDFSFKIVCFTHGSGRGMHYELYSITVDYTPWDEGRVR
jgi:hypothetical protein